MKIKHLSHHHLDIKDATQFFILEKLPQQHVKNICLNPKVISIVYQNKAQVKDYLNLDKQFIECTDIRQTMAEYASKFYTIDPSCSVIGITGTNGKTSTCWILYHSLNYLKKATGYIGTLGCYYPNGEIETPSNLTTPDPIDLYHLLSKMSKVSQYIALEVTSHSLYYSKVNYIPFYAVGLTNITAEHLDLHQTMSNYIQTKAKLFQLPHQKAYIHIDDEKFKKIAQQYQAITVGSTSADIIVFKEESPETKFTLEFTSGKLNLESQLLGGFAVKNLSLAVSIMMDCPNITKTQIKNAISACPQVPGRCKSYIDIQLLFWTMLIPQMH